MSEFASNVIHFPVDKRMSTRIAEQRLGNIMVYRYPDSLKFNGDQDGWLEAWLLKKSVLLGWEAVKEGIVKSFKAGRVRHRISQVYAYTERQHGRPSVEISCGIEAYPIFNWCSSIGIRTVPVIVLSIDQTSYFRECKRCAVREIKDREMAAKSVADKSGIDYEKIEPSYFDK